MKLLTLGNQKTAKGEGRGYLTGVLHFAPHTLSGENVCPMAELAACHIGCLNTAGRGGIAKGGMVTPETIRSGERTNKVQAARLRRTRWFLDDRDGFMAALLRDISKLAVRARRLGMVPCVRLNGTSDIRWEDIPVGKAPNIFACFRDIQFYDYTKVPNRRRALGIPNYHLTFSYSHVPAFAPIVIKALQTYGDRVNIAVVFRGKGALPAAFLGRELISGDETDLRFLDAPSRVVSLKAKGNMRRDATGFTVPV